MSACCWLLLVGVVGLALLNDILVLRGGGVRGWCDVHREYLIRQGCRRCECCGSTTS
jgi:hypothetical protein